MWLLSTSTAELRYFVDCNAVGAYAILSHVWDDDEQLFDEIRALSLSSRNILNDESHKLSAKIQNCCRFARKLGFDWVWIDTCCIDKSSSSELSEAINSMYRFYALSSVCYAYLRDVPKDTFPA